MYMYSNIPNCSIFVVKRQQTVPQEIKCAVKKKMKCRQ